MSQERPSAGLSERENRDVGCLLAGAIGDALGAAVEFDKRADILRRFGPGGIRDYAPKYGGLGRITDDTQMTLFTADGLLRAWVCGVEKGVSDATGVVAHAYLRWLRTQGHRPRRDLEFGTAKPGWPMGQRALHSARAPGNTCLTALEAMPSLGAFAPNNSKGCGGVMRVAPVGLFAFTLGRDAAFAFDLAVKLARITHGHPSGYLSAGALAALIHHVLAGLSLAHAVPPTLDLLAQHTGHEETTNLVRKAVQLAQKNASAEDAYRELGEGWVGEEALALALFCALRAPSLEEAIVLAVNHDGDSDSTGAIAGNLLGAVHGTAAIPERWLAPLELREVIETIAIDLATFPQWPRNSAGDLDDALVDKYPGY